MDTSAARRPPNQDRHGNAMLTPAQQQLKNRAHQAAGGWRNDSYRGAAGLVCREFFFKRVAQRYHLGLDEYLPEHEDAVDLYLRHLRASFDSFDAALDYLANGLRIAPESLLAPRGGLPLP